MKKYVCQVCGFVSLNEGAPDKCPVCGVPKDQFEEKEDAIKLPEDSDNLTELEKKHIPQITVNRQCGLLEGCVDVHVRMGEIIHPMLPEHFITAVDFYLDDQLISRLLLKPEKLNPAGCLHLKVNSGKIKVVSHCNLHGNWISEKDL